MGNKYHVAYYPIAICTGLTTKTSKYTSSDESRTKSAVAQLQQQVQQ